jgi:hypothetical protein
MTTRDKIISLKAVTAPAFGIVLPAPPVLRPSAHGQERHGAHAFKPGSLECAKPRSPQRGPSNAFLIGVG